MIIFAYPIFLLFILLIPIFFLSYVFYRKRINSRIKKLGNPEMVEKLMPDRSKSAGWIKLILFSLAWLFFMLGLARPQIGAKLKESTEKGSEIIIALDVSNSMLARDYSPSRLERAKMDISRMVDKLHSDRIGLVIFAGEAFVQLPITADYVSAKMFLSSINTSSVPIQGTSLADAIYTSLGSFSQDAYQGENNRAIILISDGEDHEGEAIQAAAEAHQMGVKIYCVGVGTPQGVAIQLDNGDLLKDSNGEIVVTKLNEEALKEIAREGDGIYIRATDGSFGLNDILSKMRQLEKTSYKSIAFAEYNEQYMYFFAIALFFLVLEFLIGKKKLKTKFFILILLLFVTNQSFAQLDRKEVKRGNKFFNSKHYKQAEVEYRKGLLKDSLSVVGNYNLGNTLLRMNDTQGAIGVYEKISDSVASIPYKPFWEGATTSIPPMDRKSKQIPYENYQGKPTLESNYFFNEGNAYLAAQQYDKAINAYKQSLLRNPTDMTAKANLEFAQKKLKNQQNQNQQNQQNQDQKQNPDQQNNQDQNQQDKNNKDQNQDQKDSQNQNDKNSKDQNNKDQQNNQGENSQDNRDSQNDQKEGSNGQNGGQNKNKEQAAAQILQAIQDKENKTQDKVNKAKAVQAKSKKKEKNW